MAKRAVCLCDNELIGIETIYTIIDGKQINEPEKLKEVRAKSNNKELFCSCGCGSNVILVAGDKNLRKQHFRIKSGTSDVECTYIAEGDVSVNSKIVLKCWLDKKLNAIDMQSRIPICAVDDANRRYEFSFLSKSKGIAVSYCHNRANLSEEKISVLESNGEGIHIVYVVDISNSGCNGQYPEGLMKVQEKQGYCLLLNVDGREYNSSRMKAVCYAKNAYGLWEELILAEGVIDDFSIDDNGTIIYGCAELTLLKEIALCKFEEVVKEEHRRLVLEEEKRKAEDQRISEEKKREEQERKQQNDLYMKKLKEEKAERERLKREKEEKEKLEKQQKFDNIIDAENLQQEFPVYDGDGVRWIKCDYCKEWKLQKEFSSYGGKNHINSGTCYECDKNNPNVRKNNKVNVEMSKKMYHQNKCPKCGGMLKEKNGKFGAFIGCSNYPKCDFTKNKKN